VDSGRTPTHSGRSDEPWFVSGSVSGRRFTPIGPPRSIRPPAHWRAAVRFCLTRSGVWTCPMKTPQVNRVSGPNRVDRRFAGRFVLHGWGRRSPCRRTLYSSTPGPCRIGLQRRKNPVKAATSRAEEGRVDMNPSRPKRRCGSERFLLPLVVASLLKSSPTRAAELAVPAEAAEQFFRDQALPVLKRHCFECHSHARRQGQGRAWCSTRGGGWEKGGESGPAIVPGKPGGKLADSGRALRATWRCLRRASCPPEAIAVLERWVKEGRWPILGVLKADVSRALGRGSKRDEITGRFQPTRRESAPPNVQGATWPLDDVDRFLLARLEEARVAASRRRRPLQLGCGE